MPPIKIVKLFKPSRSSWEPYGTPAAAKPDDVASSNDKGGDTAQPAPAPDPPGPKAPETPEAQQQPRVLSLTQAIISKGMTTDVTKGHLVMMVSSQWFRHPECRLDVWWKIKLKLTADDKIEVDLVCSTLETGRSVEVSVCAVQIRAIRNDDAAASACTCIPFKEAPTTLTVTGKERVLQGGELGIGRGSLDAVVLTVTIAYVAVPSHLRSQEPSTAGMDAMFGNKEFGAVNIVLDSGEQVLAHKAVLAAHSAMLKTMFAGMMQDATPNRLQVTGVSKEVLTTLLRYMYAGVIKMDHMDRESLVSLLYLADRFGVARIKQYAELALVEFLQSAESELLQVAMTASADFLRQTIFIRLTVLAGSSSCMGKGHGDQHKEASILTQVFGTNPEMLKDYFDIMTVARAPVVSATTAKDTTAPPRSTS